MTQDAHEEARHHRTVSRHYQNDAIRVKWEPELCIHAGMCWRNLPAVFHPRETPWVTVQGNAAADIARTIMQCPSGALSFERLDGGPQEKPAGVTIVDPEPDGPLYVRGQVRIEDGKGGVIREATRVTLCRCGHSENKPFCDLSHLRVGFTSG